MILAEGDYLFCGFRNGCSPDRSANLYSLIETAKANHCEPCQYLSWLLNRLPETPPERIDELMPWNMTSMSTG